MADKKAAPNKREKFENAVYDLGLLLIDNYRAGAYRGNLDVILTTIVEIFKCTREEGKARD